MRRSASEIINNLENRVASLERNATWEEVNHYTLTVNTEWSFNIPGRGLMGGSHKFYDGKVHSWRELTKNLKEILKHTREFQAEKERRPESDYSYPSGRELARQSKGYSRAIIFLYKNDRHLSDTSVVVELKYKGETFDSDHNYRMLVDFEDAVETAVNDRSFR